MVGREGEIVWGVCHLFASFNDTFIVSLFSAPQPTQRSGLPLVLRPPASLLRLRRRHRQRQHPRQPPAPSRGPAATPEHQADLELSGAQHITDISGRETVCRFTGGMQVKADRDESSPYAAMMASQSVIAKLKSVGINALHYKLRGTGGTRTRTPGPGGVAALRALARGGIKVGRIEDTTPIPTDTTRKKGGRRGRRL